jgi:hypothetical protein
MGWGCVSIFKASALWADAFYKSKCPSVCPSVCLCVCSLLRYRLLVFLPPLPDVRCPIFLKILNPWGKVMERSGLRFCGFCLTKHGGNHASRWIRDLWSKMYLLIWQNCENGIFFGKFVPCLKKLQN